MNNSWRHAVLRAVTCGAIAIVLVPGGYRARAQETEDAAAKEGQYADLPQMHCLTPREQPERRRANRRRCADADQDRATLELVSRRPGHQPEQQERQDSHAEDRPDRRRPAADRQRQPASRDLLHEERRR